MTVYCCQYFLDYTLSFILSFPVLCFCRSYNSRSCFGAQLHRLRSKEERERTRLHCQFNSFHITHTSLSALCEQALKRLLIQFFVHIPLRFESNNGDIVLRNRGALVSTVTGFSMTFSTTCGSGSMPRLIARAMSIICISRSVHFAVRSLRRSTETLDTCSQSATAGFPELLIATCVGRSFFGCVVR